MFKMSVNVSVFLKINLMEEPGQARLSLIIQPYLERTPSTHTLAPAQTDAHSHTHTRTQFYCLKETFA